MGAGGEENAQAENSGGFARASVGEEEGGDGLQLFELRGRKVKRAARWGCICLSRCFLPWCAP